MALALSAYLGWHYLVGGSLIGCGAGSSCEHVLNGRWATIGGVVPISGMAAGAYLAMLVASIAIGPSTTTPVRRLAWRTMLVLVGAAAGSAVWFTIVQKWIIGEFCPYCMATHLTGLLLAVLVIWQAPRQINDEPTDTALTSPAPNGPESGTNPEFKEAMSGTRSTASYRVIGFWVLDWFRISKFRFHIWTLAGLAVAGILAASQICFPPPAVYRAGASQYSLPAIDPRAVPLNGSPDAPQVVTLLFDYKCPHCQQMHFLLDEAIRRYGGKLAFALCPAPLESQCNPYIPRDVDEFKGSCELAKIGLAVWVANRGVFPAFNRWMFSLETGDRWKPRSLDAAKAKAVELVGQAKFDAARSAPWIDRFLQSAIRIFGAVGGHALPKLVFGSRWIVPEPYDAEDFIVILRDKLGVPMP